MLRGNNSASCSGGVKGRLALSTGSETQPPVSVTVPEVPVPIYAYAPKKGSVQSCSCHWPVVQLARIPSLSPFTIERVD